MSHRVLIVEDEPNIVLSLEFLLGEEGYAVEVASQGEKHYLRIQGFHTAGRIMISPDASEEEVKETSEILERADELDVFNAFHGSWIYEVSEFVADKFRLTRSDLVEDA